MTSPQNACWCHRSLVLQPPRVGATWAVSCRCWWLWDTRRWQLGWQLGLCCMRIAMDSEALDFSHHTYDLMPSRLPFASCSGFRVLIFFSPKRQREQPDLMLKPEGSRSISLHLVPPSSIHETWLWVSGPQQFSVWAATLFSEIYGLTQLHRNSVAALAPDRRRYQIFVERLSRLFDRT